jgi:anti-sigma regulatory factor (Ser/Thr protein kinase)
MSVTMTKTCEWRDAKFAIPAARQSVRLARRMTQAVLESWACQVDWESTVLLVSEVVTNALLHGNVRWSPGDRITVEFAESSAGLHVEVHDPDQGEREDFSVRRAGENRESGRGLELVEALSAGWGCKITPIGKSVYFDMAFAEPEKTPTPAHSMRMRIAVPM